MQDEKLIEVHGLLNYIIGGVVVVLCIKLMYI